MSRKAQALPMNTVIIAILVVLVLVVVAAFFLGGTGGIMKTIRSIFHGTTAGTDRVLAMDICKTRCDQIQTWSHVAAKDSAYCKQPFKIDSDNDGDADYVDPNDPKSGFIEYYCNTPPLVPIGSALESRKSLNVPCSLADGKQVVC